MRAADHDPPWGSGQSRPISSRSACERLPPIFPRFWQHCPSAPYMSRCAITGQPWNQAGSSGRAPMSSVRRIPKGFCLRSTLGTAIMVLFRAISSNFGSSTRWGSSKHISSGRSIGHSHSYLPRCCVTSPTCISLPSIRPASIISVQKVVPMRILR